MSRVRLLQEYRGERAGTVLEIPAGEAQRLLDTGIALPDITPKSPTADDGINITTANLVALKGAIKGFKQVVGPIDWREVELPYMKEMLGEFLLPMLPDVIPHMSQEEAEGAQVDGPECWYDHIADVLLPRLAERFEALVSDPEADPVKRDKLADAFQKFIEDQHKKLFPRSENVAEMASIAESSQPEEVVTPEVAVGTDQEVASTQDEAIANSEDTGAEEEAKASDPGKPVSKMNHEELLAHAQGLGITVPEGATNKEIRKLL